MITTHLGKKDICKEHKKARNLSKKVRKIVINTPFTFFLTVIKSSKIKNILNMTFSY